MIFVKALIIRACRGFVRKNKPMELLDLLR